MRSLTHNWVICGDRQYATSMDGHVHRFSRDEETIIGSLYTAGRSAERGQFTFVLREVVYGIGFGKLARVDGDRLVPVYDFGGDVTAFPCRNGFLIARADGLLFRVRRIQ